jgi:predicted RecB family nuclease
VADFLVRVDDAARPSATPRYMVWDAKLARSPRPAQALQLCCYAEMLAAIQGAPVERVGLILGDRPLVLRVAAYAALYRRTRDRFLAAQSRFDVHGELPELPEPRAPAGRWSALAARSLTERDDLRLVARLSKRQAARLRASGVATATELARLTDASDGAAACDGAAASDGPAAHVADAARARVADAAHASGLAPTVLRRLSRQASLQLAARRAPSEPPPFELLPTACAPRAGLGALPPPHPADAFFDLEGFPFATLPALERTAQLPDLMALSRAHAEAHMLISAPVDAAADADAPPAFAGGGREYLWGMSTRRPATDGGGAGAKEYVCWWAHSAAEERAAFGACVDWMLARKRAHAAMHFYHYGAYEISVLRRLAGRYGTREAEVDELLRSGGVHAPPPSRARSCAFCARAATRCAHVVCALRSR